MDRGGPGAIGDIDPVGAADQFRYLLDEGFPVRLWLLSDKTRVLVLVWDANPQSPVRMDIGEDAENGRGLLLVECLSAGWGCFTPERSSGKVVWAVVTEGG